MPSEILKDRDDSMTYCDVLMEYMSRVVASGDATHLETACPWVTRICQTETIMSSVENQVLFDEMLRCAAKEPQQVIRLPRLALLRAAASD